MFDRKTEESGHKKGLFKLLNKNSDEAAPDAEPSEEATNKSVEPGQSSHHGHHLSALLHPIRALKREDSGSARSSPEPDSAWVRPSRSSLQQQKDTSQSPSRSANRSPERSPLRSPQRSPSISEVSTPTAASNEGQSYFDFQNSPESRGSSDKTQGDEGAFENLKRYFTNESAKSDSGTQTTTTDISNTDRENVLKLLNVDVDDDEGLALGQFPAWLAKDVLLQGKIYLTKRYLLFYAHMPPQTLEPLRETALRKKNKKILPGKASFTRYWFVLRMGSLVWYSNPGNAYFPSGILPMKYMARITSEGDDGRKFSIVDIDGNSHSFKADSANAAHEWKKAIQKEIFRARNKGDGIACVRIPLPNIISHRVINVMDVTNVLRFKVVGAAEDPDHPGRPLVGDYAFALFGSGSLLDTLVKRISAATDDFKAQRGVHFLGNDEHEVDFAQSKFGPFSEEVFDTTPPAVFQFELASGRTVHAPGHLGIDQNSMSLVASSSNSSISQAAPVGNPPSFPGLRRESSRLTTPSSPPLSRPISRSQSRLSSRASTPHAGTPTSSGHHWSKINILSAVNQRLNKLKVDDSSSVSLTGSNKPLLKLPTYGDNDDTSDEDTADASDDDAFENDSDSDDEINGNSKFFDDKVVPFVPQNFKRKVSFGTSMPTQPRPADIDCKYVENDEELAQFNEMFREHFGLEENVVLRTEYLCNLRKPGDATSWGGKLFMSNLFLCFQRRNLAGGNWKMVIPLRDITHISVSGQDSKSFEFEVSEPAYGGFKLLFSEVSMRQDAENTLRELVNKAPDEDPDDRRNKRLRSENSGEDSEQRFLEYNIRSARLSTYEPSMSNKLQQRIPPMMFDATSSEFNEVFLKKPLRPMKFVMMMIGSRGDVQPYISLSLGLMAEGHKCCIVTHKQFKDWIEGFNIEYRELAGDPTKLMELMIDHGSFSYSFFRDALQNFTGWIKELMRSSWKSIKHSGADVLIESPSSMIGIHIAEALQIPYFRAFTMPWTRTRTYPQALITTDQKMGGGYNYLTYVMFDRLVWLGISKHVNKWRKHHLSLPPTDLDHMSQDDVPFLYCVSPTVLVPPLDQPDWVHTCGYWDLKQDSNEDPDPKLIAFIKRAREAKKPLVYIGFGSIVVSDVEATTDTVVGATKDAGVYCVLARGWASKGAKSKEDKKKEQKPINEENIFEVDSVSHQWLFPQLDAIVHHGGSGTTGASLRAGKPTIIKPFFGDQFFYGRRVEDLGVGVNLKRLTKSGLSGALKTCVTDKAMIRQAEVLGEQIQHEHGVEEAVLAIYRELAYAQLVTNRRRANTIEAKLDQNIFEHILSAPEKLFSGKNSLSDNALHSMLPLPKLGRRQEQVNTRNHGADAGDSEVDVSV